MVHYFRFIVILPVFLNFLELLVLCQKVFFTVASSDFCLIFLFRLMLFLGHGISGFESCICHREDSENHLCVWHSSVKSVRR